MFMFIRSLTTTIEWCSRTCMSVILCMRVQAGLAVLRSVCRCNAWRYPMGYLCTRIYGGKVHATYPFWINGLLFSGCTQQQTCSMKIWKFIVITYSVQRCIYIRSWICLPRLALMWHYLFEYAWMLASEQNSKNKTQFTMSIRYHFNIHYQ